MHSAHVLRTTSLKERPLESPPSRNEEITTQETLEAPAGLCIGLVHASAQFFLDAEGDQSDPHHRMPVNTTS